MNRTRVWSNRDGKVYHSLFHDNMLLLMEFNPVPSELKRCFKMDMFAVPNMVGFMHVTHFLLKIIYPKTNEFRDCWPAYEKSQERDFRNKATQMLRVIRTDFPNFQFPEIVPSKFLSPGGFWFITLIWNLTVLAMQVQAKRDLGLSLLSKPSGKLEKVLKPSAIKLLNLYNRENKEKLEKVKSSMRSFMNSFNETNQFLLNKQQMYKSCQNQYISSLDEDERWNTLDVEERKEIIGIDTEEHVSRIGGKHNSIENERANNCELINVDALKNQAEIINTVKHRAELGHNYVINSKNLIGGDSSEILPSKHIRTDVDVPDGKSIILLDYFNKPLEELKSMKLDWKKEDLSFQLEDWKRIQKEFEENKNEMLRLELLLNNKLAEFNAKYNQERYLPGKAEVPESSLSILSDSQNLCTSTPIKSSHEKPLDITPYRKPSPGDYFDETYRELLAEASRKTHSVRTVTEHTPQPSISNASLDELRERLKKIQLSMKKE